MNKESKFISYSRIYFEIGLKAEKISKKKISEEGFLDLDQNIKKFHSGVISGLYNFDNSMVSLNFAQIAFRKNWPYKIASGLISDMLHWLTSFPKIFIFHPVLPTIIGRHLGLFLTKFEFYKENRRQGHSGIKMRLMTQSKSNQIFPC